MKKITQLLALLACSSVLYAQTSGGPDAYGYTWKNSNHATTPPAFQWFDITTIGTQVTGLSDDNVVGPFTASAGFQFYWYGTPQFYIGSNGYVSFAGDNIASPFPANIPLSAGSNDWLAPFLSDLNFSGVGNPATCYYYSNADTLCVSFIDVPFWVVTGNKYTGRNTFQIIMNKADRSITFNYLIVDPGTRALPPDMAIGIENVTGTLGLPVLIDALPNDTFSIKFYYPPTVTYMAIDGGIESNGNAINGGEFISANGPALDLTSTVRNYGNTSLSNFSVLDTLYDASGTVVSNGSASIASLAAGSTSTITFSNTFSPTTPGIYRYKTFIAGISGDLVAANDEIEQELVVVDTSTRLMTLEYSDETPDGAGLGWNGGDGGIGIYFEPPIYPAKILTSRFYINANASPAVGFYAKIFDDDGPNGDRGTLLDSIYVAPGSVTLNVYTNVDHSSNNIVIDSGGFYLVWHMDGAGIDLARDLTNPISRRTYEILGPGWSGYRRKLTEDFLMGVKIDYAYPFADFTSVNGLDPIITFYDMSTNNPTNWLWDFGDGTSSTTKNPFHTYLNNGEYDVCLTASNSWGSDSVCKRITVTQVQPEAKFTFSTASSPTIVFTDQSFGPPISWAWDFDDGIGDTSTIQHPSHTFQTNGTHNVCLIIGSTVGISAPYCQFVQVTGVGLDETDRQTLSIQPNPASRYAMIKIGNHRLEQGFEIIAFNAAGARVMLPYQVDKNQIELRVEQLEPGLYHLQMKFADGTIERIQLMVD